MSHHVRKEVVLGRALAVMTRSGRGVLDLPDVVAGLVEAEPDLAHVLTEAGVDLERLGRCTEPVAAPSLRGHTFSDFPQDGETRVSSGAAELLDALNGTSEPSEVLRIVRRHGLTGELRSAPAHGSGQLATPGMPDRGATGIAAPQRQEQVPRYTVDLTALGACGAIDPVLGRDAEIDRLTRILQRRRKPNPLLVGPPGVGKTAVVEGLAARISLGSVAPRLRSTRILSVDFAGMISGTRYRGEFEGRLRGLLEEVAADPRRPVLFIDEAQVIVGTGRAEGGMDASAILLPALARGELCVIGATTPVEYETYFATDTALGRRFEPVFIHEPTPEVAADILAGLCSIYEAHHGVMVDAVAIAAAVSISVAGAPHRHLPDKALDLLDEACAMVANRQREEVDAERVGTADVVAVAVERGWVSASQKTSPTRRPSPGAAPTA